MGLSAILGDKNDISNLRGPVGYLNKDVVGAKEPQDTSDIIRIPVGMIEPNPFQPRQSFDQDALSELAESIRTFGLIQPITVRKKSEGKYQIISGERRFKACSMAGLDMIPAYIRDANDQGMLEMAIVENIQREDLNPIDEAMGYKKLIDDFGLTQEEVAQKVSKSRTAVTNTMRLLKLSDGVQKMVVDGTLSAGHARALLALENDTVQEKAAQAVIDGNLSVRQTENLVKNLNSPKKPGKPAKIKNDFIYDDLEKQIADFLGTKVKISQKEKGKGRIEISYYSEDDLDRILNLIRK